MLKFNNSDWWARLEGKKDSSYAIKNGVNNYNDDGGKIQLLLIFLNDLKMQVLYKLKNLDEESVN
jgi:hypothetical protein